MDERGCERKEGETLSAQGVWLDWPMLVVPVKNLKVSTLRLPWTSSPVLLAQATARAAVMF